MKTFQFTLKGFDGSTCDTDDLIKWIGAPNQATAEDYANNAEWDYESVEEIFPGKRPSLENGCDVIICTSIRPRVTI